MCQILERVLELRVSLSFARLTISVDVARSELRNGSVDVRKVEERAAKERQFVTEKGHPNRDERAEASTQTKVDIGDVGIEGEGFDSCFVEAGDEAVIEGTNIETDGGLVGNLGNINGVELRSDNRRRTLTLNPHVSSTPPLMEMSKTSWG
jgi:hypothetical protein